MQNDLIRRSALIEMFEAEGLGDHSLIESVFAAGVYAKIENAPSVEAVEVVPCRDCKYWSGRNDKPGEVTDIGYCDHPNHHIMPLRADWFCADGKRMDEKEAPHEENPDPV